MRLCSPPNASPPGAAPEEPQQFPHWRRNRRVLPVCNFLGSLAFSIAWPFLPLMLRSLGVVEHLETWIGYMMLVFYAIGFVVSPVWGGIADHYGRKIMVLRASLGMGFFMTLLPFAPTPLWFAFVFMLVGFFNGFIPSGMALLVANTPPERLGGALSVAQTGSLVGATIGPAAGAMLAAIMDRQHWLFWISGGLLLVASGLVAAFVHEVRQPVAGPWRIEWVRSLRELLAVPRMGSLYFLGFVVAMLWNANVTIISIYALQLLAADPGAGRTEAYWVGAAAMALSVSSVVALPLWGRVLDRFDPARVLAFATAAAALTHVPLLVLQTPLQLVLARVAFGLSAAAMQPAIIQLLKRHAPSGMDARAISYATSFQYVASGLAPFAAGVIGPVLGLRFYFALAIALTLGGLAMWLRNRDRPPIPH